MGDVSDLTNQIGESFVINGEDAQKMALAFPVILQYYQITADGMIDLNDDIAKSAIETATTDLESSVDAQVQMIYVYIEYATGMRDMYKAEAKALTEKAVAGVETQVEANKIMADSDNKLHRAEGEGLNYLW